MFRAEYKELYQPWRRIGVYSTKEIADYFSEVFRKGHSACDVQVVPASPEEMKNFDPEAERATLARLRSQADVHLIQEVKSHA